MYFNQIGLLKAIRKNKYALAMLEINKYARRFFLI